MPATSAGLLLYRWRAGPAQRTLDVTDAPGAAERVLEVLLVHPGGPYFAKKDAGAWSIPKGEVEAGELGEAPPVPARDAAWRRPDPGKLRLRAGAADLLAVARREFREETGFDPDELAAPAATYLPLGAVKLKGHKIVHAWALEGDCEPGDIESNTFAIEWPPRSGRRQAFPEVDRAAWFELPEARQAVNPAQRRFIDDLEAKLGEQSAS